MVHKFTIIFIIQEVMGMKLYTPIRKLGITLGLFMVVASQQASAITINLDFSLGGLSASQQTIFGQAELFWEGVLTGYQPSVSPAIEATGITISAQGTAIDGVGGTLGSAGPQTIWNSGGFVLTSTGLMNFDTADLDNMESGGTLQAVILHEMAHVLGFGTLWSETYNNVYTTGSGQYTGAAGLAAYNAEFGQSGSFIPVELGGGAGTAGAHWNEVDGGGGLTGITDGSGNDMRDELMTGWLNANTFVSNPTRQSFVDIGYTVAAVPVPAAVWLFISGFGLLYGFANKKQRTAC